ncbi:MAG TPA: HAMP domain-containing protein [Candidatus Polarisedimenticolaceae bacterium]
MIPPAERPDAGQHPTDALSWRHGLRARLVTAVLAAVLAPTAILGWAGFAGVEALRQRVIAERLSLARAVAHQSEHRLRETLENLASVPAQTPWVGETDAQRTSMRIVRARSRMVTTVALVSSEGRILAEEPAGGASASQADAAVRFAADVLSTGRSAVRVLTVPDGSPVVGAAVALRDSSGHRVQAAIAIWEVQSASWAATLAELGPGGRAVVDLLDDRGVIAVSTDPSRAGSIADSAVVATLRARRTAGSAASSDEDPIYHAWAPVAVVPWGVLVSEPETTLFADVRRARRPWDALATIVPLLGLVLALGVAWSVREPIARLGTAAQRIAAGDLSHPIPQLGSDEIGSLSRAFEAMRAALQESHDALTRTNRDLDRRVDERTRELQRLYAELRLKDEQRGLLLRKLLRAEEEERKRIARELHDDTCQAIAALGMSVDLAADSEDLAVARERLADAKALVVRSLDELHRVIYDLRPSVLDDLGLEASVRWLAKRHLEPFGIRAHVDFEATARPLPMEVELGVFRALQEALSNVARHSRAERVWIQVACLDDELRADIEDDGVGFVPAATATPTPDGAGLGLLGMRERMQALGGEARVESTPGEGTHVALRVPLRKEAVRG